MKITTLVATLAVPILLTIGALVLWAQTDYHAYTKYEVVERIPIEPGDDDLFAATGLFDSTDDKPAYRTVQRDSFHFGLLPTPQGLIDKHMFSVLTIAVPPWLLAFGFLGFLAWHNRRARGSLRDQQPSPSGDNPV